MMKHFLMIPLLLVGIQLRAQSIDSIEKKRILLPNGWGITVVGKSLPLGDLPLNLAVSPDRKYMAVTNNGESTESIQLIDLSLGRISDTHEVSVAWLGLAWSDNSRMLYASGGNGNYILRFEIRNGKLQPYDTLFIGKPWPQKISVAGIAIDDKNHRLYAVTKYNNSVYIYGLAEKKLLKRIQLEGEAYTCILSPDKQKLYVSCWGCNKVYMINTGEMKIMGSVPAGDHPNELLLSKNGKLLYVANANDNSVSVLDLKQQKVIETLNAALYPAAPSGSTTNGIALDKSGKTLFIANADNNCLAVFDVSVPGKSKSKGFIPVGWYPTCVRVAGKMIYVANGKGFTSLPNPDGPNPMRKKGTMVHQEGGAGAEKEQYIAGLFMGTLSMIPVPDEKTLSGYSRIVYRNSPYSKEKETRNTAPAGNPVPSKAGDPSPVKYVFYIIKENRTYDQVLGDLPEGNGDSNLCLFGEEISPNHHQLAREFGLFDNFFADAEISADGHEWSMGAYATDFVEKMWPIQYGHNKRGMSPSSSNRFSSLRKRSARLASG